MFTERQSRRPLAQQAVDRDLNDEFLTSRNSGLGISRPVAWMTHLVNALPARKNKSSPEESLYGAPHMLQFYIMRLSSVSNRQYERDRSIPGGYVTVGVDWRPWDKNAGSCPDSTKPIDAESGLPTIPATRTPKRHRRRRTRLGWQL